MTSADADARPVARVVVDVEPVHLDRPFDYLVPADLDASAVPGCRVRVRFSGRLVDGWLLERVHASGHQGRLTPITKVVSPEPVLAPEVAALARAVADRYAGTLADVLRLAVPPRHARVEAAAAATGAGPTPRSDAPPAGPAAGLERYVGGAALLRALADGRSPRAVWTALPGPTWPAELAAVVAAAAGSGRGVVVVVPDARDVVRVDAALTDALGADRHVVLAADLGPAERYRRWLRVRRGEVRVAVGTRAAAFAPVVDPGLLVVWDDGDDLHAEQRSPYPHVREVLGLRAHLAGAALLVGGHVRTAEGQLLLETGWARPLVADRAVVRDVAPRVTATGSDTDLARDEAARSARLPTVAWQAVRAALAAGAPALVQVPRRGYVPSLACGDCRTPARCPHCSGPLGLSALGLSAHTGRRRGEDAGVPSCRWCARPAAGWRCPTCRSPALRATVVGAGRTAEELGRAFPGVPVKTSGRDGVLATVSDEPSLVVATPGAEPVPEGAGYGVVLLLDAWALLSRPDLRAGEETLRRWAAAAALARPAAAGGSVVVVADPALPGVQALVRWDPAGAAERELAERASVGFPPAVRMASATGSPAAVADLLAAARSGLLPASVDVLGPVPLPPSPDGTPQERLLLRVPRRDGTALAVALKAAAGSRSARKAEAVRLQVDPSDLV